MKIVQVANFYGPHSGGLRTTVDAVGRGYQEAGHERILVVPDASDGDEQTPVGRRITLRSPVLPAFGGYRAILDWRITATAIGELQPDRLEVSDKLSLWPLGLWAKRRGLPATLLSHERIDAILSVRFPGWFPLRQAADSWNRKLASAFEVVIAASAFSRSEWDRIGATNVRTVPLGVDLEVFSPGGEERSEPAGIVCVGRLSKEKRPDLAIDAIAELTKAKIPVRLTMIGAGPDGARLMRAARGLPVRFVGHVEQATLALLLSAAAVALAPCPHEAFGLSVLEALASGTPVVTTDCGAAPELLAPGCGLAVTPRQIAIAAAIAKVLHWPQEQVRRSSRAQAERFPWSAAVAGMLSAHGLRPPLARPAAA
jgi:alpha-1,6-mannosyltransferase